MNINPESAKDIPCKNVLIYGHCKYENQGCVFAHPGSETSLSPSTENTILTPTLKLALLSANTQNSGAKADTSFTARSLAAASPTPATKLATTAATDSKRKFNMNTPSFQPLVQNVTNKFATLSPKLKEIPVFVPSAMDSSSTAPSAALSVHDNSSVANNTFSGRKFNTSTPSFSPLSPFEGSHSFASLCAVNSDGFTSSYSQVNPENRILALLSSVQGTQPTAQPPLPKQPNPYLNTLAPAAATPPVSTHPVNATDFMFHNQGTLSYPLNHHLYAPAPPPRLAAPLKPHQTNANAMFIPNNLRETLTKKNEATLQTLPQLSFPEHVDVYHSLVSIDASFEQLSTVYHLPSYVYKVLSNYDGLPYVLRRIDQGSKLRIFNESPFANVKKWRALQNANVVRLHDAFTSISLSLNGEPSLFLAYDYYPLANTLQEQHITRKLGSKLEPITEETLWSYLVQLTGALISIHEAGLHAGSSLSVSKVLVTNKDRVRLGAVGIDDILESESIEELEENVSQEDVTRKQQLEDVARLGKLMTDLASTVLPTNFRGLPTPSLIARLQQSSGAAISEKMTDALSALQEANEDFDLNEFYVDHLARVALKILNGLQDLADYLEGQLLSEVENGRLFRLLAKINVVLDRPENGGDVTGSTFVIKLFRDHMFHTFDEYGKPAVDLSRILVNLNKLDVGVEEKLLLVSREDDSCIIASYKEIKDTLELSFRTLIR